MDTNSKEFRVVLWIMRVNWRPFVVEFVENFCNFSRLQLLNLL